MSYLDKANSAPVKKKSYLDLANNAPSKELEQEKPFVGDLLPKFSISTPTEKLESTITPTDIISGTIPYKATKALTGGLAERFKQTIGTEKLSDEPIVSQEKVRGILPTSAVNIGLLAGARTPTPRNIIETGIDIASSPETYTGAELARPGIISRPLEGIATKLEDVLPKEVAPTIGQKGLSVFKTGRDYLYEKVAKPASELITNTIKKNPKLAESLGLRKEAIDLIKTHGFDKVANVEEANALAKEAFDVANSQKTSVFGNKIDVGDTIDLIGRKYNLIKKTDKGNPLGKLYQSWKGLRKAPQGFYGEGQPVPTSTELGRVFKGEKLETIGKEARVTRDEFSNIREQIDNLYRARVINKKDVLDIIDSLYNDAEKSGLKGIQKARELFHQAKQFEDVAKNISKAEVLDSAKVHRDILSVAKSPEVYKVMVDKYTPYIGKDTAEKIFNEALASRKGKKIIKAGLTGGGIIAAGRAGYGIFH